MNVMTGIVYISEMEMIVEKICLQSVSEVTNS